ncbi:transcription factor S [Candidatus Bathyarchaeota archaeon]|nr:transcription factor S [Candidatus Bathyarchaeota archaeon]MBL7079166.1 transcription factor S [Candidatus Bathyarchaeota archaeon]
MKFCSKCGTVLKLDAKKKLYVCQKCGTKEQMEGEIVIPRNNKGQDKIIVIGKKERNLSTLPQTKVKCPKCDNAIAYWWMVQTRGIDESATQFFRCTKCGHTWRDYT